MSSLYVIVRVGTREPLSFGRPKGGGFPVDAFLTEDDAWRWVGVSDISTPEDADAVRAHWAVVRYAEVEP